MARIVFFGNERLATGVTTECLVLKALIEAGHEVVAVVTNYEAASSRKARELEIQSVAEAHNIPVLFPAKLTEIADDLRAMNADIGVLVAFGQIVPESVIDIFPHGIINLHPSLLPLHRGPTPIESVILDGAETTGVSIMQLAKAMDAGDVFAQSVIDLKGTETKQALADQALEIGARMTVELLPDILDGLVAALPQDHTLATYDQKITKQAGELDFNKSAERLEREIRAYAEWPKSRTKIGNIDVIITAAHAVPTNHSDIPGELEIDRDIPVIMIDTADGCLCIDRLKPAGKNEMDVSSFLAGYSIA